MVRAAAILALLAGCSAAEAPRWHVARGFLRAADGRAVIMRGANVSDAQKHAPYLDFAAPADYQKLAELGLDAIRFVMPWAAVEPERGRYDDAYLDGVATRLDWAAQAGLWVVLDMHEDVYGEGFGFDGAPGWTCDASHYATFVPRTPWYLDNLDENVIACVDHFWSDADLQAHFVAAWRHVADRLARAPAVVGFDALNEPPWGSYSIFDFEADRLAPLYARVTATVRGAAPAWIAFLEPSSSRNAGIPTGLPRPPYGDVVYAPHAYDSASEGGAAFDLTRRQTILDNVAALAGEARALGAALWIGEYGGPATLPGIADYLRADYDAAGAVAASTMYWEYGRDGGYGLYDSDGNEKPALVDAVTRPYPERVAGDPISYAYDEATRTLTFVYTPDGSALPTELVAPARLYPSPPSVECGGCPVDATTPGRVRLLTPPPGRPATVTLRPQ